MLGFALPCFEGQMLKTSLDLESRSILSFNLGTWKRVFEEHAMIEKLKIQYFLSQNSVWQTLKVCKKSRMFKWLGNRKKTKGNG